jgi:hypothetical protein
MSGKTIIILVIGFSIVTSFFILKLNANSKEGLKTTVDHFSDIQARLIANSGAEVYLEKLRRNKTLHGTFNNNYVMDGYYDIDISGPDSFLTITSTGHFNGVDHKSIIRASREPVDLPPSLGALYIVSDVLGLQLNGNLDIDGNDTNTDGTAGSEPALPGVVLDDPSDSAYFMNNIKSKISNDIEGFGGSPSVYSSPDTTDWEEIVMNTIFAADITVSSGTYSSGTFGTPTEPKITFMNGEIHLSGTCQGDGIMIINGNLTMSGDFTYRGIILVYDKSSIDCQITGNGGVYGTTILVGSDVNLHSTGNAAFYYSSQAINNSKLYLKSSRFDIASWWE